jgi:hypothetical protein
VKAAHPETLIHAYRDLAIVDRDDLNCGIVDDIEFEQREGGLWELTALLVGPGAWRRRKPRALTALLPGRRVVRVDAADVASTGNHVRLMKKAAELGLAPVEQAMLRRFGTN